MSASILKQDPSTQKEITRNQQAFFYQTTLKQQKIRQKVEVNFQERQEEWGGAWRERRGEAKSYSNHGVEASTQCYLRSLTLVRSRWEATTCPAPLVPP